MKITYSSNLHSVQYSCIIGFVHVRKISQATPVVEEAESSTKDRK
jgi:hypothetical protein